MHSHEIWPWGLIWKFFHTVIAFLNLIGIWCYDNICLILEFIRQYLLIPNIICQYHDTFWLYETIYLIYLIHISYFLTLFDIIWTYILVSENIWLHSLTILLEHFLMHNYLKVCSKQKIDLHTNLWAESSLCPWKSLFILVRPSFRPTAYLYDIVSL